MIQTIYPDCPYADDSRIPRRCRKKNSTISVGVCLHCKGMPTELPPMPCPPDADWCVKYGLPTGPAACAVCTAVRESRTANDPELGPWFAQMMRTIGHFYSAMRCQHLQDSGRTEQQRCCGGKVKEVPLMICDKTGQKARCSACRDRAV